MKIDPNYAFLHAFFLICPSCLFQNLSIWPKTHPFFQFACFCTPKRCTRVHCLVLKNNSNYVNFWRSLIPPPDIQVPPPPRWKEVLTKLDANLWEIWQKFKCRRSMSYPPGNVIAPPVTCRMSYPPGNVIAPPVTCWQSENSFYTKAHFAYANLYVAPDMSIERHSAISDTLTKWKFPLHWSTFCIRQFIRRARYFSTFR